MQLQEIWLLEAFRPHEPGRTWHERFTVSVSITRQAVPSVASSSWEVIDDHLLNARGDWQLLRGMLIGAVAGRLAAEGNPVSLVEGRLLVGFYASGGVRVGFLDALEFVRRETAVWPDAVLNLANHALAADPSFTLSWETLRTLAPKAKAAPVAKRRTTPLSAHDHRAAAMAAGSRGAE